MDTLTDPPSRPHPDLASETLAGRQQRAYDIDFTLPVSPGGYLWWYVDAMSDNGRHAMTLIVFIGSVFSPYYARARRRGKPTPEEHCAFNTILYGPDGGRRWSMTERSSRRLQRARHRLQIGPSSLTWDGCQLIAQIDERCAPVPTPVRGRIAVTPTPLTSHSLELDAAGRHLWHPLAPIAHVEVDMTAPALRWEGEGYLDSNEGREALEAGFDDWDWSRARRHNGDCSVLYHTRARDGAERRLSLNFDGQGQMRSLPAPPMRVLKKAPIWRMPRNTLAAANAGATIRRTLEDTPFYARSLVETALEDESLIAVHESLCLRRFASRWVQTLLPVRMPRRD